MKLPARVIATIVAVFLLAGAIILAQRYSSAPKAVKLSAKDMEALLGTLPPEQVQQMASTPSQKKQLVDELKKILAVGSFAESAGFADRPTEKMEISFQSDLLLANAYEHSHPNTHATDEEISQYNQGHSQEFESFLQAEPKYQGVSGPQKENLKHAFAEVKVLASKAKHDGLDKDRATEVSMTVGRYQVLSSAYEDELRNSDKLVTDQDVNQYFQAHPDEFVELRARHILVSTQSPPGGDEDETAPKGADSDKPKPLSTDEARKKAQSILDRLKKGEDFATLAKENSDDPGSKASGGDLGYFTRGKMVPQFEQAAFSLKPGQMSDLVQTNYGFHIILVLDRREQSPTDPKVHDEIAAKLKDDKVKSRIDQIVKDSKVTIAEDFQTPAAPATQQALPPGHPGSPH